MSFSIYNSYDKTPQILNDIAKAFENKTLCELLIKHEGKEIKIPCYVSNWIIPTEPPYSIDMSIVSAGELKQTK